MANSTRPEAIARRAEARRGRPFHPNAAAALARVNGWRRWTAEEDRLLGILSDWEIARRTGHRIGGVRTRRNKLGIPPVPREGQEAVKWRSRSRRKKVGVPADMVTSAGISATAGSRSGIRRPSSAGSSSSATASCAVFASRKIRISPDVPAMVFLTAAGASG